MADHETNTATKIPTAELDRLAREAGMMSVLSDGAGSFVWSAGCNGVTAEHLRRFAALVTARALAAPVPAAPSQVCSASSPGLEQTFPGLAAQGATQEPVGWLLTRSDNGIEQLTRDKNWIDFSRRVGHSVTPLYAAPVGQAETTAQLTDEQIEQIAHRQAWRYKHHDDPAQREYTFTRHRLLDFVQAVQSQPGDAK